MRAYQLSDDDIEKILAPLRQALLSAHSFVCSVNREVKRIDQIDYLAAYDEFEAGDSVTITFEINGANH